MSRIGKLPVEMPSGVSTDISKNLISVSGPKGKLSEKIIKHVNIVLDGSNIVISVDKPDDKKQRSFWGLYRSLIANMVKGVTDGFEKRLEINGVGYKVNVSGKKLALDVGLSHQVVFDIPEDINIEIEKNVIIISGIRKQSVGEVAAQIRKIKKIEPYKLKGIKYIDEHVKKKVGKAAKGSGE